MKIAEWVVQGKQSDPLLCEDALVLRPQFAAVIDGVTSKGGRLWQGRSSGRYASECLARALNSEEAAGMNSVQLFAYLDRCLRESWMGETLETQELPRASVIVYNERFRQVWSYGDCQCLINDVLHSHSKPVDHLAADLRAFVLEYERLQGKTEEALFAEDPGRAAIGPLLRMQLAFENHPGPWGYPVLNGQGICPEMIAVYPVQPGDEVILTSDGYPMLMNTLEKSEQALARLLQEDPHCCRTNRSTKGKAAAAVSYDDRCYCRVLA